MRTKEQLRTTKTRTNSEKLEQFKLYVIDPFCKTTYKTYVMFEKTCRLLQDNYLDANNKKFLADLKEHIMLFKELSQIKSLTIEQVKEIRDKFDYYKYFIISESEINRY